MSEAYSHLYFLWPAALASAESVLRLHGSVAREACSDRIVRYILSGCFFNPLGQCDQCYSELCTHAPYTKYMTVRATYIVLEQKLWHRSNLKVRGRQAQRA